MFTRHTHWMLGDDEAPDVYTVKRKDDKFRVGHFASYQATQEHCHVVVRITEADRHSDAGAEVAALFRANILIERKHSEVGR
jgi:hypothetical protein